MKLFLILFLLSFHSFAQDGQFHLNSGNERINKDQVPEGIVIDQAPRAQKLRPKDRDVILNKYFKSEISSFDDVDRDILYQSIINYPPERLFKKYKFINQSNYKKVKDELL